MQNLIRNNLTKVVIFEAIAANVGSSLTPIGNPPNLFLWHQWGISFLTFTASLFPLFAVLLSLLLLYACLVFKSKRVVSYKPEIAGDAAHIALQSRGDDETC